MDAGKSKNVPGFFGSMAEFTARHTCTQTVVADTDGVVLEGVGKVIVTLGHGTNEDANALVGTHGLDVVGGSHHGGLETEGHLPAVGGEVVRDRVLDDLEQLLLRVCRADRQPVKELNHQTGEPLEGSGDTDGGVHFDQNPFGGVNENLQSSGLVDGRVEEGQEALQQNHSQSTEQDRYEG